MCFTLVSHARLPPVLLELVCVSAWMSVLYSCIPRWITSCASGARVCQRVNVCASHLYSTLVYLQCFWNWCVWGRECLCFKFVFNCQALPRMFACPVAPSHSVWWSCGGAGVGWRVMCVECKCMLCEPYEYALLNTFVFGNFCNRSSCRKLWQLQSLA